MGQIWTIGHWTHPEETFLGLLEAEGIEVLADVRAQPGSRRSPQFSRDVMPAWLQSADIEYTHLDDLRGRRPKQDVDPDLNSGWRNASFKNYADYTLSPAYERGVRALTDLGTGHRVVVMCGEPMPWRCHRLLIANTLTSRGWTVRHILGDGESRVHRLGDWGAAPLLDVRGRLLYPG